MPKIAATKIAGIADSVVSTDGRHMVLRLRAADGDELPLALHRDQIAPLIDHCSMALSCSDKMLGIEPEKIPITWWNSGIDAASRELTLALTFGHGGTLSFALSDHMARALLATLRGHYEAEKQDDHLVRCDVDVGLAPGFIDID